MSLAGKVCIVTGATRGIGKGIALQLGEAGATVYITGRSLTAASGNPVGGSLTETAKEIETRGGKCIPIQCDHSKDDDVLKLFEKVKQEQDGQLDILVNNAYAAVTAIGENSGIPFWEQPLSIWDTVNNVGLRNHYICAVHAAKLMVQRKRGLIINISSGGGLKYLFNVCYGIGKEACDRMAADCAVELKQHNVTFVSLWPGPVSTEVVEAAKKKWDKDSGSHQLFANAESTEYSGTAIVHLARDPNLIKKTGKILMTGDLGNEYGFKDIDGRTLVASTSDPVGGSLTDTAEEIQSRGGKCIPVQCDHTKDEDIQKLFDKVKTEQKGQLDILVNNAYSAVKAITENMNVKFWEQPMSMWDTVNNVGLRNHYLCSIHAAKMMVPRKQGLIVNVSSMGGLRYLFNIPYGVGKEACDRMAVDCAAELKKYNVTYISLWPGLVQTENIGHFIGTGDFKPKIMGRKDIDMKAAFDKAESVEFAGKAICHLAKDPNMIKKTGRILLTAELGMEYGFTDVNGRVVPSMRQINNILSYDPRGAWLAMFIPNFVRIPFWMLAMGGNKF